MQKNNSHSCQGNYQAIISLMQTYDCSYEQAEKHFQLLRMSKQTSSSVNHHSFNDTIMSEHNKFIYHQEVLDADTIIPFTPKEYRALKMFFSGNVHYSKKKPNPSFCQKVTAKFKDLRRKIKCLKYLNPKRVWRAIRRRRQTSNYNRLINNESSLSQSVKVSNQRWFQIDQDWMDQLEENSNQLTNYLNNHKHLLRQVNSMSREGVKTTLPDNMELPPSLQPYLFIRERSAESIASNVKETAQKIFKIICLDNRQFALLHNQAQSLTEKTICSLAYVNIFEEVQILKVYNTAAELDIEKGQKIFKHFLIKNRLFKSIVDREMSEFAFTVEQPQLQDYDEQDQQDEARRKQTETHQDIIKQQDMLYQSMLSSYVSKEAEKEKVDQIEIDYQKRREEAKLAIREEPTASQQTIHIVFRTPTGQTLSRNFHKQDTLEYVKNWIFCQDQIEFENATSSFDLYYGYPPALVETKPNQALWSIFGEEQSKLRLIIKEN